MKNIKNLSYILEEILEYSVDKNMINNPVYTTESSRIIADAYINDYRKILGKFSMWIKVQRD